MAIFESLHLIFNIEVVDKQRALVGIQGKWLTVTEESSSSSTALYLGSESLATCSTPSTNNTSLSSRASQNSKAQSTSGHRHSWTHSYNSQRLVTSKYSSFSVLLLYYLTTSWFDTLSLAANFSVCLYCYLYYHLFLKIPKCQLCEIHSVIFFQ